MANTINVGMDVSQLKAAAAEMQAALNGAASTTLKLATESVNLNSKLKAKVATITAVTEEGTKLTAKVKETAAGFKVLSIAVKASNDDLQATKDAAKAAAKELDSTAKGIAGFKDATEKFKLQQLADDAKKAAKSTKEYDEALRGAGDSGKTSGEKISVSWQAVVRIFETQVIRQAVRSIITQMTQGITSAEQFTIEIGKIQGISQNAGQTTSQWTTELRALSEQFGTPQIDVAKAAYVALQSQLVTAANSSDLLSTALKFGNVTSLGAVESTKLLTNTLNAFKLPASEGERVANVLFKSIANGAVGSHELATEFQKLASTAGGTGVKLEEIAAAVETLVNKGVKFSDATSLINGLLTQTIKPTKALKEAFLDMGATSGEAFIAMKGGFGGFLSFLDQESQRGNSRLGELVGSFRNIRGSLNLTGNAFSAYADNLAKVSSNTGELNKASDILGQTVGQKIKIEFNKVKTFFTDEFGVTIIKEILAVSKFLGGDEGMVGAIKRLIFVAKEAAIVFAAFKAGQIGVAAFNAIAAGYAAITLRIQAMTVGLEAAAYSQNKLNVAQAANLKGGIAGAAGGFGALAGIGLGIATVAGQTINEAYDNPDSKKSFDDFKEQGAKKFKASQENSAARLKQERDDQNEIIKITKEAYDQNYKTILQYTANIVKATEDHRLKAVDNLKEISEQVKITGRTYTDFLGKGISDINRLIHQYQTDIKGSQKFLQDLERQTSQNIFKFKEAFAAGADIGNFGNIRQANFRGGENQGPDQGIFFQEQRRQKLLSEARQKEQEALEPRRNGETREDFATRTTGALTEIRRLYAEAEKLEESAYSRGIQNQKKALDIAVAIHNKDGSPVPGSIDSGGGGTDRAQVVRRTGLNGQTVYELLVKSIPLEEKINALNKERIDFENQLQAKRQEGIKAREKEASDEKERLRTVAQGLKDAASFSVLDKEGKIRKEYKDDPTRAGREFQGILDKIENAAGPDALKGQFQIFSDLYKQRVAVVNQVETQIRAEQARTISENLTQEKKRKDETIGKAGNTVQQSQASIQTEIEKLTGFLAALESKAVSTGRQFPSPAEGNFKERLAGIAQRAYPIGADKRLAEDKAVDAAEPARQKAVERLGELQKSFADYTAKKSEETAALLIKAAREFEVADREYIAKRTGRDSSDVSFPGDQSGKSAATNLRQVTESAQKIADAQADIKKAQASLFDIQRDALNAQDSLDKIPKTLRDIGPAAQTGVGVASQQINDLKLSADGYIQKLIEIQDRMKALSAETPARRGDFGPVDPLSPDGRMFGGVAPKYYAHGGGVNWKSRGSDRIPAMLAQDEFVVNAQAARQFKPQLEAINNFQQPRYMASGGSVTNVGDINVNVSGGDTSTRTIREIATGLRRELRRGTVTLG